MKLAETVAIVTGGASGLGAATARRLAGAGAKIIVADLNEAGGQQVAEEIGGRFVRCNVTDEADAQAAVDAARESFGGLTGLVNCAGIGAPQRTVGRDGPIPLDNFSRVIQVNLIGSFNMIRLAAAAMMDSNANAAGERGVIINTASGGSSAIIGVSNRPGAMVITRMPNLAISRAMGRVMPTTPALEAA